jgi:hypothetical protein
MHKIIVTALTGLALFATSASASPGSYADLANPDERIVHRCAFEHNGFIVEGCEFKGLTSTPGIFTAAEGPQLVAVGKPEARYSPGRWIQPFGVPGDQRYSAKFVEFWNLRKRAVVNTGTRRLVYRGTDGAS